MGPLDRYFQQERNQRAEQQRRLEENIALNNRVHPNDLGCYEPPIEKETIVGKVSRERIDTYDKTQRQNFDGKSFSELNPDERAKVQWERDCDAIASMGNIFGTFQ